MTAVSAPVSPRVERKSPASGKHKPCKGKEPVGGGFRTLLRKSADGTKISRRKPRGCTAFPRRLTADGNADRLRLCGAFWSKTENRNLGVAVFERKYGRKRRSDGGQAQQNSPKNESQRTQPKSEKRGGKPIRTSPPKKETAPDETEAEIIKDLAEMEEQTHEPI